MDIELPIEFYDNNKNIYAKVVKKIYIADKKHFKQKKITK